MTATTITPLTDSCWVALGSGPMLLGASGDQISFALGAQPAAADAAGFEIPRGAAPITIPAGQTVWARGRIGSRNACAIVAALSAAT
jgi:hypothetical protein